MIKVGLCGFAKPQRVVFESFPMMEVQHTFYQPPRVTTLEAWRERAPSKFEFTIKAWQAITHLSTSPTYRRVKDDIAREEAGCFRPTPVVRAAWQRTRESAAALKARIVLFQCAAHFTPTEAHIADMQRFFAEIARDRLILAWEPRGDWPDEWIRGLCEELGLIHAVDPFIRRPVHGEIAYLRLHGGKNFAHRYSDAELREVLALARRYETAYVLFNNRGMFEDAQRFAALADAKRPACPSSSSPTPSPA
jgi:uncharacterized protein YecE (DUF72 family)